MAASSRTLELPTTASSELAGGERKMAASAPKQRGPQNRVPTDRGRCIVTPSTPGRLRQCFSSPMPSRTDNAFALVMPYVNTEAMQVFLDRFAATIGDDEHVAMVLDQAGWHASGALRIPDNVTLVPLPPYSPELNPVERVWLHLKERFLSHRLLADYDAIADAACNAWNRLCAEVGRLTSLCSYPWIPQVRR